MKAVILAGGLGSRLSEETTLRPKPMVEIGGKPILWHIMKIYSAHGVHEFVICLGYKGYLIKEYFANYFLHISDVTFDVANNSMEVHQSAAEPWRVTLVDTGEATQTGGRLKRVLPFVEDERAFHLTYGDGVADIDLGALAEHHADQGTLATVTAVQPTGRFGAMELDGERVRGFQEKPDGDGAWINGGFFVLSPRVGDYIEGERLGGRAARAPGRRRPAGHLPASGLLAGDGHGAGSKCAGERMARGRCAVAAMDLSSGFWAGRHVLVTGHTGFKGSWLSLWLQELGARVAGVALGPPQGPSLFDEARVGEGLRTFEADPRSLPALDAAFAEHRPDVVLHLAAQPIVSSSLRDPVGTFEANVMGTVNVLDAARRAGGVRAVVNVTSDKAYADDGSGRAHGEGDRLGGRDPYSASKACSELVTAAYRDSFGGPALATARAGNVIGGGDWGRDRLISDLMRAALGGERARIRRPQAVRPWQHVLNPVSGYLLLAQRLCERGREAEGAWNFGPDEGDAWPVERVLERVQELWGEPIDIELDPEPGFEETHHLQLDSSKARAELGWRPAWGIEEGLRAVVEWYRGWHAGEDAKALTVGQIRAHPAAAALAAAAG